MNRNEYLLVKVAEEAVEVAQRADKALIFGVKEVQAHVGANPDRFDNGVRLMLEYCDLLATIELCQLEGILPEWAPHVIRDHIDAKKRKIQRYFEYSVEQGTVSA